MMNQLKTGVLLAALTGVLLWVGQLVGGPQGLIFALFFAIILNVGSLWFSDKVVLRMYKAKPLHNPAIRDMVKDITKKADLPMPKLYEINSNNPNAFATGRNPEHSAIAVTTGIQSLLTKDELKAVLAHEIGHIKNRDTLIATVAATLAGVISYVAMMARWAAIFGGGRDNDNNLLELMALMFVTPIMALLIQLAISRSREYLADQRGAEYTNPKHLQQALLKLHQGNKLNKMKGNPAAASLFIVNPFTSTMQSLLSTHPPMKKRIEKLNKL